MGADRGYMGVDRGYMGVDYPALHLIARDME